MLGNGFIGVRGERLQPGNELRVAAVPHGDGEIAAQAGIFSALDGGAAEGGAKILLTQCGQPFQRRIYQFSPGLKFGSGWRLRLIVASIPGTDVLADVAAKDMAANTGAQSFGNSAALFDGEISNAEVRIHLIG